MNILLPYYSPTKVLLIDDELAVLENLKKDLPSSCVSFKTFSNPFEAIEYINKAVDSIPYKKVRQSGESLLGGNIDSSYEEIFSPSRFQQISTVIVDYDMPGMNGIEFCQKIDNPHIQKILLTGAATEKTAVGTAPH